MGTQLAQEILIALSLILSPLAAVLGALALRAACWVVGVKKPSFAKALAATILVMALGGGVGITAEVVLQTTQGRWVRWGPLFASLSPELLAAVVGLPVGFFLAAAVYCRVLDDANFGRSVLLVLAQAFVCLLAAVVLAGGLMVMRLAMSGRPLF